MDERFNIGFLDLVAVTLPPPHQFISDGTCLLTRDISSSMIARYLEHIFSESNMYAVIRTGGKQYRVSAGAKIKVEQIPAGVGAEVSLDQVLMIGEGETVKIGTPVLSGATVTAKVISQGRHPKVKIFKMRRRKHYQKHQGHRQNYTELEIGIISA